MPKVTWDEINQLIHEAKDELTIVAGIEVNARKLRTRLAETLDKINKIILEQTEYD